MSVFAIEKRRLKYHLINQKIIIHVLLEDNDKLLVVANVTPLYLFLLKKVLFINLKSTLILNISTCKYIIKYDNNNQRSSDAWTMMQV